jgi:hypothetical protein
MRTTIFIQAFIACLIFTSSTSYAYETYCRTGSVSSKILRVTVPPEKRESFIEFLQSDLKPLVLNARYVGGAESDRRLSICFLEVPNPETESRIDIVAENIKPSSVFDFSIETCNTRRSWKPYFKAIQVRMQELDYVSVSEIKAKKKKEI